MSNTKTDAQSLADFAKQLSDEGPMIHTLSWPQLSGACQMFSDELRRLETAHTVAVELAALYAAEGDQLRAQLAKAVAEEREACALECESRQANGNRTHTHPDECAAAIRARSNT